MIFISAAFLTFFIVEARIFHEPGINRTDVGHVFQLIDTLENAYNFQNSSIIEPFLDTNFVFLNKFNKSGLGIRKERNEFLKSFTNSKPKMTVKFSNLKIEQGTLRTLRISYRKTENCNGTTIRHHGYIQVKRDSWPLLIGFIHNFVDLVV